MPLWWIANVIGAAVVIPLVIVLANRIIRLGVEIERDADDILEHGVLITAALDPVPALLDTRDLVSQVTANATRYVTALERAI